ncbi:hypothetical protein RHGRI_020789 [Rhododendron griersonianum]|uniref:GRF-type domain-containing protein n=1 Tax=Rhododendron griersonianum TaxID=479676 RepID=A0AAV6JHL2_9ERIC|nr:hypothetical protein RHGRI_020789 [Rhododendron griersonianum]
MSSSSTSTNFCQYKGEERCECGRRVVMRTSLTVKNPGRRFLGCINYKKENDCNFFVWVDPETCPRGLEYAKIMQAKKDELERQVQELKMINEGLERGKQMVEEENDALVVKLADLTEMNINLRTMNEAKKTREFGTCFSGKIIVVVVILFVIIYVIGVFVSTVNHSPKKSPLYLPSL